jgi:hypothetical protein
LAGALTDETGSGSAVFATSPTLVTPALGTPSALVGTNITGTAAGLTAGNVTTNANLTGAITSVGNATSLGSFSSANLAAAVTDETGTGALVFATSPTLVTPALGTPASGVVTNLTGTASININGTVGATTPAAGAFTTLSATGVTTVQAGTAALPAIITSGDTNTGFWFPAADTLAASTAGSERLRITSAGNVGIGNAAPSHTLTVGSASAADFVIALRGGVGGFFGWDDSANTTILQAPSTRSLSFQVNSDSFSAGTEAMRITSAGNVGIGTTAPVNRLSISDSNATAYTSTGATAVPVGAILTVANASNTDGGLSGISLGANQAAGTAGLTYICNVSSTGSLAGNLVFGRRTGSATYAETMRINTAGNVGIGTITPDANLTVNGAASFAAGTALLPSIARSGDLNTGFWFPAADTIAASTAGSERLRIDSSGNVGIGTSAPTVASGSGVTIFASTVARLTLKNTTTGDGVNDGGGLFNSGLDLYLENREAGNLVFFNNGSERLRITSAGNVGIGESAPDYKLDVNGTFGFTPGASVTPADNGDVVFELTNNTTLTVKAKGSDGVVRSGTIVLV